MEQDTAGSIFQILDFRSLANAKARIEQAEGKDRPTDAAALRYTQIQMELVGEELGIDTSEVPASD